MQIKMKKKQKITTAHYGSSFVVIWNWCIKSYNLADSEQ